MSHPNHHCQNADFWGARPSRSHPSASRRRNQRAKTALQSALVLLAEDAFHLLNQLKPIAYLLVMNTLEQIEQAASNLLRRTLDRLALWVSARYHDRWKRQMDRDATAGKLDFLFNEAAPETSGRGAPRLAFRQG